MRESDFTGGFVAECSPLSRPLSRRHSGYKETVTFAVFVCIITTENQLYLPNMLMWKHVDKCKWHVVMLWCCSSHCPGLWLTARSCATVCSLLLRFAFPLSSFVYIWHLYAPLLFCLVCIERSQQWAAICRAAKPTFSLLCTMVWVSPQSHISELILSADIFVCLNLSTWGLRIGKNIIFLHNAFFHGTKAPCRSFETPHGTRAEARVGLGISVVRRPPTSSPRSIIFSANFN